MNKLRIVIDCRFWGLEHTGLGRYTMRLVEELTKLDHINQYYLLFRKATFERLTPPFPLFGKEGDSLSLNKERVKVSLNRNFYIIAVDAPPYTIKEQLLLTKVLRQLKPDIYHAIDLNIPVLWRGKLIVTIHDLTRQTTESGTTLPKPLYLLKKLVFNHWVTPQALHIASAIIVPSNFVKNEIIKNVETSKRRNVETKTHVTHEAPDPIYFTRDDPSYSRDHPSQILKRHKIKQPYLIYTGNAYPHKNLPNLIQAIKIVNNLTMKQFNNETIFLAIACGRDVFRTRVEEYVNQQGMQDYVKFLGFVPDEDLRELYRHSLAFITPSLSEGFGLPGLEAMAAGAPVLSSNASCLPEIYGAAAIYFNPHKPHDIAAKIQQALNLKPAQRQTIINQTLKHSQTFSWQKMAEETLKIYKSV